jgi:tRNA pseudouridine synthase 10
MSESPARSSKLRRVFLESRYRKLARGLPQTIFYCPICKGNRWRRRNCRNCGGHGKLTKDSVQEFIARRVLPAFQTRKGKFHGAGREDLDVRMLGSGRPFVFEVVGARKTDVGLEELRRQIHATCDGAIELAPFREVSRKRVAYWKEARFRKIYRAQVRLSEPVEPELLVALREWRGIVVQRTPKRVAHRRADMAREREVEVLELQGLDPECLELQTRCAHGTYVKEWISGDEGRTQPSLSSLLGVACSCEALDVEEIVIEG